MTSSANDHISEEGTATVTARQTHSWQVGSCSDSVWPSRRWLLLLQTLNPPGDKDMHLWVRATVFLEKASRKWAQAMTVSTIIVSLPWQRKGHMRSQWLLSPSLGERYHQKPAPWSWTVSFQKYEKINLYYVNYLVCDILLQHPENTNT